jgi:hypothetical protein
MKGQCLYYHKIRAECDYIFTVFAAEPAYHNVKAEGVICNVSKTERDPDWNYHSVKAGFDYTVLLESERAADLNYYNVRV